MSKESYKVEVLSMFVIEKPAKTRIVNTEIIPSEIKGEDLDSLLRYHPRRGEDYSVTTVIQGAGDDAHLAIKLHGGGWNDGQRELIEQLKFVPTTESKIANYPPVLMMLRSGNGNIPLRHTHWHLVSARIEKRTIEDKEYNDVNLLWEYRAPGTTFLKPVVTCWKW